MVDKELVMGTALVSLGFVLVIFIVIRACDQVRQCRRILKRQIVVDNWQIESGCFKQEQSNNTPSLDG